MTARTESSLSTQLGRMERARAARTERPVLRDRHITLSHGAGGKASQQLLEALILPGLHADSEAPAADAAVLDIPAGAGRLAFTTDSYVVSPLFFPGGDIGSLAVHGTVNDLAMSGARPAWLSLGFILEEGLDVEVLRRVVASVGAAARAAGVRVVTGDTKVVPRGKADGIFVNTAGVGFVPSEIVLSPAAARPGDRVLVSGYLGDHGMAILLAREALELEAAIESDSAPLHGLVAALLAAAPGVRCLKDPTRGGLASSLNEVAGHSGVGIVIEEERVPVRPVVRGACEMLGLDPLHIANEGKLMAIVAATDAPAALEALRSHPFGVDAAEVGEVVAEPEGMVLVRTGVGGSRVLDMLVGDPLPRIC